MKLTRALSLLLLGLTVLAVVWVLTYLITALSAKHQIDASNLERCHLVQEEITPGFTRAQVQQALDGYGPYSMTEACFPGERCTLRIAFSDPATWDRFGSDLVLEFDHGLFEGAWIPRGVGESSPACAR